MAMVRGKLETGGRGVMRVWTVGVSWTSQDMMDNRNFF